MLCFRINYKEMKSKNKVYPVIFLLICYVKGQEVSVQDNPYTNYNSSGVSSSTTSRYGEVNPYSQPSDNAYNQNDIQGNQNDPYGQRDQYGNRIGQTDIYNRGKNEFDYNNQNQYPGGTNQYPGGSNQHPGGAWRNNIFESGRRPFDAHTTLIKEA